MSQVANPCCSSAVAIDGILKSYKDIRQQQKDIFHALNWCLGGCMEEWEWSLSLCEYSLKVLQREPHFLILFCCIKMVTVAMCLLCLPSAVCGAVHRPAVLILQSRGIQRTAIECVVHISLLYRRCSVWSGNSNTSYMWSYRQINMLHKHLSVEKNGLTWDRRKDWANVWRK